MGSDERASDFSEQVDRLLAGEHRESGEPLLALAAEMAADPALDPSPLFVARLRRRLLTTPSGRAARVRRRRSLAAIPVVAVVAALVLVLTPGRPTAGVILARAAEATAVEPGQIEHVVYRARAAWDCSQPIYIGVAEYWNRFESSPEGNTVRAETLHITYAVEDGSLGQPQMALRTTESRVCLYSFGPHTTVLWDWDAEGCVSRSEGAGALLGGSIHEWIGWIRDLGKHVSAEESTVDGRRVFRISCGSAGEGSATVGCDGISMLLDGETYLPLGISVEYGGVQFGSEVFEYGIFDPSELEDDPFTWPPDVDGRIGAGSAPESDSASGS
ncbi:MAG: hypothetical protein E3J64_02265 [Anaerolineales bacterium]|nr:MAG: hypothetical protein E3J64_02265 [Anaerolineales bacterium]